jgi:hypothetical protein
MTETLPAIVRPNGKLYRPRYLRVVGWDIMSHGEPRWIHDDVKGAACVIFDESDDPPEAAS